MLKIAEEIYCFENENFTQESSLGNINIDSLSKATGAD